MKIENTVSSEMEKDNTMSPIDDRKDEESSKDWREGLSLLTTLTHFSNKIETDDKSHDVVFVVGRGSKKMKLYSHRFILCWRSQEFEKLLARSGNDHEPSSSASTSVHQGKLLLLLPEYNAKTFRIILKFVYTDQLESIEDVNEVLNVLELDKKFKIHDLGSQCIEMAKDLLDDYNSIRVLEFATDHKMSVLETHAKEYIISRGKEIIEQPEFLRLSDENLLYVVQSDELDVDELRLFQRVVSWAKNKCTWLYRPLSPKNIYDVLRGSGVLYAIRFPLISVQDFEKCVIPTRILSKKSVDDIKKYFIHSADSCYKDEDVARITIGTKYPFKKRKTQNAPIKDDSEPRRLPASQAPSEHHRGQNSPFGTTSTISPDIPSRISLSPISPIPLDGEESRFSLSPADTVERNVSQSERQSDSQAQQRPWNYRRGFEFSPERYRHQGQAQERASFSKRHFEPAREREPNYSQDVKNDTLKWESKSTFSPIRNVHGERCRYGGWRTPFRPRSIVLRSFPCKFCVKVFESKAELHRHVTTTTHDHEKRFKCPYPQCDKRYTTKKCLVNHRQNKRHW